MKKTYIVILTIIFVVIMAACGNNSASGDENTVDNVGNTLPDSFIKLEAGEWHDNEYTANIPKPESAELLRGWIDPEKEYCYIELSDMTQTKSEQYVDSLREAGFLEVEKVSEEINDDYVSIGTLLTKDRIIISIAYGDNSLGMYIVMQNA